jgi:putative heme-binding domain-containing protein
MGRGESAKLPDELPQHNAVDLDYTLNGVEATWTSVQGESFSLWLPHLDLDVSRQLTSASAAHRQFFERLALPGRLTLRTGVNLSQLLRPAVQPGATIDYAWPPESPTLQLMSAASLQEVKAEAPWAVVKHNGPAAEIRVERPLANEDRLPLEVALDTGAGAAMSVAFRTNEDDRLRALPLSRFFLPWAPRAGSSDQPPPRVLPPELAGGDWSRGREIFYQSRGQCSTCHTVDGRGGRIGPDLSNLRQRDFASVLRDIAAPSAAINPEFIAYALHLTDGDRLQVAFPKETSSGVTVEETVIAKEDIEALQPLATSIMPEGLAKTLGEEAMKHLLTFLLAPPPEELRPAPIERPGAPPPRKRADVHAVLDRATSAKQDPTKPLRILLVAGPKDHGPSEHDYPQWQKRWEKLLSLAKSVQVETADSWPTLEQWKTADVAVFYSANPAWAPDKAQELDAFQQRGGGLVLLHYAVNGQRAPEELAQRIGLAWQGGVSKFRHGELTLDFGPQREHPIVAGLPQKLDFTDESYWQLAGDRQRINVLASGMEDGQPQPLLWTYERGQGRVFCSILGHYNWTFDDPLFRILLLRAIAWTARQPPDRLTELATVGARMVE